MRQLADPERDADDGRQQQRQRLQPVLGDHRLDATAGRRRRSARRRARRRSLRANERPTGSSFLHIGQVGETNRSSWLRPSALPAADAGPCARRDRRGRTRGAGSPISTAVRVVRAPSGATRSCSTPICRARARTTAASATTTIHEHDLRDDQRFHGSGRAPFWIARCQARTGGRRPRRAAGRRPMAATTVSQSSQRRAPRAEAVPAATASSDAWPARGCAPPAAS